MSRIIILTLISIALACQARSQVMLTDRPSIVVVMLDDMRADQLAHLPLTRARLEPQAVRFDRAYVNSPVCGPSRVSFLSGQYVHTHGIDCNDGSAMTFKGRVHLGERLQAAGYRTCGIGKYLNGLDKVNYTPWPPVIPGWDDQRWMVEPGDYLEYRLAENGTVQRYTTAYSTTRLGQLARQCLTDTPASAPLFLYFTPKTPHAPFTVETDADLTYGKSQPFLPQQSFAFNDPDVADEHPYLHALLPATADEIKTAKNRYQKANGMLRSADRAIAALWDAFEASGRNANTIWFLFSDNGYMYLDHRIRKGKGCVFEECIRTPLLVRVPGTLPRVEPRLVSLTDITATISAVAGATWPYPLAGFNLLPLIADPATPWRTDLLVEYLSTVGEHPPFQMIVTSDGTMHDTYAEYLDGFVAYYDLAKDPAQAANGRVSASGAVISARRSRLAWYRSQP